LFLNQKRFWKTADELADLYTILLAAFRNLFWFIGFKNSFITTAAAFQNGFSQSDCTKSMEIH
jgi:hypothetical protein